VATSAIVDAGHKPVGQLSAAGATGRKRMALAEQTAAAPAVGLLRNRWLRILGVAFVMYVLSYIDRVNIAMAVPAMRTELGLSPAAVGFAVGLFPWGYIYHPANPRRSVGGRVERKTGHTDSAGVVERGRLVDRFRE
jgi:hypothetical protein